MAETFQFRWQRDVEPFLVLGEETTVMGSLARFMQTATMSIIGVVPSVAGASCLPRAGMASWQASEMECGG